MQIKKSELRSVIKEQVAAFFVTPEPLGMVSRSNNLASSLIKFGTNDVNEKELNKVIKQTMSELEEEATKRMKSSKLKEAAIAGKAKGISTRVKEVEQHWMKQFESILKRKAPKLVGQVEDARAQYMQTMGYTPEDAVKDIIQPGSLERSNHSKIKNSNCVEGMIAEAKKKPAKWYDAIKRPVKVGDKVHVGHAQKGGAGVEGKVTKIAGNVVYIKNDAGKTYKGPLKNTAIMEISGVDSLKPNDPHTPEDEAEKDAADDVMEAGAKKGGRPRGAPHIENVRFWDMSEIQLKYLIKDASEAVKANPMARKALKWADEINDAVTVLYFRKKKGIKESFNVAPPGQGKEAASVIGANESPEIGSLATTPKAKNLIKQMHILVSKELKLKSIEDIQPIQGGVAFIFGEKKDAAKMTNYLKKKKVLGKVIPIRADRTMVSLKLGTA